ncbi:MAG TPA: hypothetical protein VHD36_20195 [Pirellulales bacterium]|nr:hypothetical protein [Pirellulales bacterium]
MDTTEAVDAVRSLARRVLDREFILEAYGEAEFYLRLIILCGRLQNYYLRESGEVLVPVREEVADLISQYKELGLADREAGEYLTVAAENLKYSSESCASQERPWAVLSHHTEYASIPNMLHPDTMAYLEWLASTHGTTGECVELGCWLGSGSRCLVRGLQRNLRRESKLLHVYDRFTWEDYMTRLLRADVRSELQVTTGDSFRSVFERMCGDWLDYVEIHECDVTLTMTNGLEWSGQSIGIIVFDMSQDFHLTQVLWERFVPYFVPDHTVVVFQQYGNARAGGLRTFCAEHSQVLLPLHKPEGSAKGFLFHL